MASSDAYTTKDEIDSAYAALHETFATRKTYSLGYRVYQLKQLAYLIHDNRTAIHAAVKEDLGGGQFAVDLCDVFPILNEVDLAIKRLPKWAKDETRYMDSMLTFKFMSPRIHKQPKGVALIISPWNYPWQLTFIPLVNAIAAGCPALIKPSEFSPASSALMAKLLPLYLDSQAYRVVLGDAEQSTHLLKRPWGHIMYTGSDRVGKIVAKAAADTLTPTTLELGGKSPVIITEDADIPKTVKRMFTIKQLNTGQMCVTPDYVLCAEEIVDKFIAECKKTLDEFFPPFPHENSILHAPMASHLRSSKDFERQAAFIQQAESAGKLVYKGEVDVEKRRMGFSIVKLSLDGQGEKGGLVEEEIFGPVLPIIPVSSLDSAIRYINARPHPLSVYVCSSRKSVFNKVVKETISGSVTWNDFAFAVFARSLPFGGVGGSGWGAYHGYDGFVTFTHAKSTLQVPLLFEPLMSLRYPPVRPFAERALRFLLTTSLPARPKSVEDEERRMKWRKWRGTLILMLVLGVAGVVGGAVGGTRR
ncbi:Aldehyde/histidinol dehydrogenase [Papiliotrema laurentii]|uniref:Aldehyde dehydrogenase n=1 Tax=Papiliotrema laurentii TaxID=5418 RepID=A0AAD9CWC8_PAPLA|nr:Aldehyde/histidinol dehydrogenase [Papiliotrema laurentii]